MPPGPPPQVDKDTLIRQDPSRVYLGVISPRGWSRALSLECAEVGQHKPAELILYYTIMTMKMRRRNSGLMAATTDTRP